ncbi:MAG: hypothetical protein ACRCR9_05730 [Chitinophagaceae bacterium]
MKIIIINYTVFFSKIVSIFLLFYLYWGGIGVCQSQVNTRESGEYRSCFTWVDQTLVGQEDIHIGPGHIVEVTANHKAFNTIILSNSNSAFELKGMTGIDISTDKGNINMNTCRINYEQNDYNASACFPLWYIPGYSWTGYISGSSQNHIFPLEMAKIERPGNYKLTKVKLLFTLPWGGDLGFDLCNRTRFVFQEVVLRKNGVNMKVWNEWYYSSGYTFTTGKLSNCSIPGGPTSVSSTAGEYPYFYGLPINLGYCNVGDEISLTVKVVSEGPTGGIRCTVGNMRVFAQYNIKRD